MSSSANTSMTSKFEHGIRAPGMLPMLKNNYMLWKFKMERALRVRNLWNVVSGREPMPEGVTERDEWIERDEEAQHCIVVTVDDEHTSYLYNTHTSKMMWESLEEVFLERSTANSMSLKNEFYNCKKDTKLTMQQHTMKLREMLHHLDAIGVAIPKEDVVMVLLNSIPEDYKSVRSTIKTIPGMTLEMVEARLREEEKDLGLEKRKERETEDDEKAFLAASKGSWSNLTCFKCGRTGHFARSCRSSVTRSPAVGGRAPSNGMEGQKQANMSSIRCFACHQMGHKASECVTNSQGGMNSSNAMIAETMGHAMLGVVGGEPWIMDSGASQHICKDASMFAELVPLLVPTSIRVGNNSVVEATHIGRVELQMKVGDSKALGILGNVLYAPQMARNLFSVASCVKAGNQVRFGNHGVEVVNGMNKVVAKGELANGLWSLLSQTAIDDEEEAQLANAAGNMKLWHRRLGHLGLQNVLRMRDENMVSGLQGKLENTLDKCHACSAGKMVRKPAPAVEERRTDEVLELVHSDVMGPFKTVSLGGGRYIVTFIDDFSRKIWVNVIESKDQVLEKFQAFVNMVENMTGKKVKRVRSDNGGEYTSRQMREYCEEKGIEQDFVPPYEQHMNGVAERANRTLQEIVASMMEDSHAPQNLWGEAVMTAAHIKNRVPHSKTGSKTPEEVFTKRKASVNHMKVFGCKVEVLIPKVLRKHKFAARTWKGIFVGYAGRTMGYRVYDPLSRKVFIRRDVDFFEEEEEISSIKVEERGNACMDVQGDQEAQLIGNGETEARSKILENDESRDLELVNSANQIGDVEVSEMEVEDVTEQSEEKVRLIYTRLQLPLNCLWNQGDLQEPESFPRDLPLTSLVKVCLQSVTSPSHRQKQLRKPLLVTTASDGERQSLRKWLPCTKTKHGRW